MELTMNITIRSAKSPDLAAQTKKSPDFEAHKKRKDK